MEELILIMTPLASFPFGFRPSLFLSRFDDAGFCEPGTYVGMPATYGYQPGDNQPARLALPI
jgi:hypothetical protein